MKFIQGFDRNQMQFFAYEQLISTDNDVRFIDAFVDSLPLGAMWATAWQTKLQF